MFNKEYSFIGTHAYKVRNLTNKFNDNSAKLFNRNIDVYIIAPIIGFLYGIKSPLDKSSDTTKIFPEQLMKENSTLRYNYQLILLLDKIYEEAFEERIKKAFMYYGSADALKDEQLFEEYVRGGVDVLYEKLIESSDDYIRNLYNFIEEFNERYNNNIPNDIITELCNLARR